MASSRVLAHFCMLFDLRSHYFSSQSLDFLIQSTCLLWQLLMPFFWMFPCVLEPQLPWFYLEVPNFSFLLESFSSPNTFFPNVPSSSTFLFISLVLMPVHLAKYNLLVLFLHRTSAGSFHLAVSYISISNVCFLIF